MGGCRCTFRLCENSSSSKPGMHFFHFPIRDWPRLQRWAANADKPDFTDLPLSKLKNKVVCQEHFENKMFMNYLKEGLVKTAVPALDILQSGGVWNVETNVVSEREEWVIPEKDSSDSDTVHASVESQTTRMEIQFLDSEQEEFNVTPVCDMQPVLLNKTPSPVPVRLSLAEKPKKTAPMTPPTHAVLRKVIIKRKNPSSDNSSHTSKVQVLSIQPLKKKSPTKSEEEYMTEEAPSVATPSSSTDVSTEKSEPKATKQPSQPPPSPPPPAAPVVQIVTDPVYVEKLKQTTTGIEEVKKILMDVLNKPPQEPKIITIPVPTPAPQAEPSDASFLKPEKGAHMNKVQLFNGIKRYLNPTMVALLRMELFAGSAERQWKADEKTLGVELINLGENVYDHFCDEFRFRLPPKNDVQKWKAEAMDDDGDAS